MYLWWWHHVLWQAVNDTAKDHSAFVFSVKQSTMTSTSGTACLQDKDMHNCSPNSTVSHPRNFNILPIPKFMLCTFTCTTLNISHLYYQFVQHVGVGRGGGPKYNLMTAGSFLKLNKHFNESKCELTVLNKEEKYVNQSGHTQTHFNSW